MPEVTAATWQWDASHLRILDNGLAEAHARAGEHAHCGRGCFGCCLGPFPITILDAHRLRRGLATLQADDPARAHRIESRAAEAWAALLSDFPGNPAPRLLDPARAEAELYSPRLAMLPCPALDLETGACDLYHHRPLACRTFGLAVTVAGQPLDHCRLNYTGLSRSEIDTLRLDLPMPAAAPDLPPGVTVVAAALAPPTQSAPAAPEPPPASGPAASTTPPAAPAS